VVIWKVILSHEDVTIFKMRNEWIMIPAVLLGRSLAVVQIIRERPPRCEAVKAQPGSRSFIIIFFRSYASHVGYRLGTAVMKSEVLSMARL
jgi:hypothetical protein